MSDHLVTERHFRVDGSWWVLQVGAHTPDDHGSCDYEAKTIRVADPVGSREGLATVIHETVHAAMPWAEESTVAVAERAVLEAVDAYLDAVGGRVLFNQ